MAYHAAPDLLPGGFVGVDVFFVISGYLITGIVSDEVLRGSFSFGGFYARRMKRLLPAFHLVILASGLVAWRLLLPDEWLAFGRSVVSALFFSANFHFASVTEGYFAPDVRELPMLHTWSLAVEEQFYLVWPLVLVAFDRLAGGRGRRAFLIALALGSFVAAELAARSFSDAVFYAPWARAGELAIGAWLALNHRTGAPRRSLPRAWLGAGLGLSAVVGSALWLDDHSVFPGLHAIWACLGTALLIDVGRDPAAPSRRLLGMRPWVGLGLISYPLYLWHWPILAFSRVLRIEPTPERQALLIGLALGLSTLSYIVVERPIRRASSLGFVPAFGLLFALPTLLLAALAMGVLSSDGSTTFTRGNARLAEVLAAVYSDPTGARGPCMKSDEAALPPAEACRLGDVTRPGPDALLWGDSIANHFTGFFDVVGEASGLQIRDVTMSGCLPVVGTLRLERKKGPTCRARNDRVLELVRTHHFEAVLLGGRWDSPFERGGLLGDDVDRTLSVSSSARALRAGLERTLAAIVDAGARPIVLRSVPRMPFDAARCAARNAHHPERFARPCEIARARHLEQQAAVDAIFDELARRHPTLGFLALDDLVCDRTTCMAALDGTPLYRDAYHLSLMGSRALGRARLVAWGPLALDSPTH